MTTVEITTAGGVYDLASVRWEVRDEIEVELAAGRTAGIVTCGGSAFSWRVPVSAYTPERRAAYDRVGREMRRRAEWERQQDALWVSSQSGSE